MHKICIFGSRLACTQNTKAFKLLPRLLVEASKAAVPRHLLPVSIGPEVSLHDAKAIIKSKEIVIAVYDGFAGEDFQCLLTIAANEGKRIIILKSIGLLPENLSDLSTLGARITVEEFDIFRLEELPALVAKSINITKYIGQNGG